jgi:hypothetical protein
LRAILSADVKGYSLPMADDEIATIQTITTYREIMRSLIDQLKGRVVDSPYPCNRLLESISLELSRRCYQKIERAKPILSVS